MCDKLKDGILSILSDSQLCKSDQKVLDKGQEKNMCSRVSSAASQNIQGFTSNLNLFFKKVCNRIDFVNYFKMSFFDFRGNGPFDEIEMWFIYGQGIHIWNLYTQPSVIIRKKLGFKKSTNMFVITFFIMYVTFINYKIG